MGNLNLGFLVNFTNFEISKFDLKEDRNFDRNIFTQDFWGNFTPFGKMDTICLNSSTQ